MSKRRLAGGVYLLEFSLTDPLKLPKITLPPFYGEIVKWTSYWEIFNSMVHDIGSYSDITKMIYLVSPLKGDASNIIKGLAVTAGN